MIVTQPSSCFYTFSFSVSFSSSSLFISVQDLYRQRCQDSTLPKQRIVCNNHLRTMQDIDLSLRLVPDLLAHLYASSCFTNNNCAAAGAQSRRLGSMLIKTLSSSRRGAFCRNRKDLSRAPRLDSVQNYQI